RVDGGDRGHGLVTEYLAAARIDRHDSSAVARALQHLHDGAAGGGRTLARADHGNAFRREEGRESAGVHGRLCAPQTMKGSKMAEPVELLIQGRAHELGPGFAVRRVLPSVKRRMLGPFIFLDHFGPMVVPPGGDGMEVRPHPHIGLATVTYLFDGGIFHRDSLGYAQAIRPGDVNWMTAGSGIAHSERTEEAMKKSGFTVHGVQTWVALPHSHEETGPSFEHISVDRLPAWSEAGGSFRLIVGSYAGRTAPTTHFTPTFYVAGELAAAAKAAVSPEHAERAVYVAE